MVRAHLIISGIVQGVFFRSSMKRMADILKVKGWVKNRWDGKVEAVVEGEEEAVKKLIEWAHKGPPYARVDKVEVEWEDYTGEFDNFSIRY
ncbi:acylphosphatase [Candidatus Calescamantes bacterium]|nr:acylphosphatase [Candidatus Calescamantes bacterium]HDO71343.1 acylphosphatase [bacterium]HEX68351.1 acylphosphatase [bacterium]